MSLAYLRYCSSRQEPPTSQLPNSAQNATKTLETANSAMGARQVQQRDPAIPKIQSDHKIWSSIKSLTGRVAQNLMSLILTGQLRTTIIENFKTTLKRASSSANRLECQCKFYESCCTLLDIGCMADSVMKELENTLPKNEYEALHQKFLNYGKMLNEEGRINVVATELLRNVFVRYFSVCLEGQFLASHSMLKHIEKMLVYMRRDGIDVSANTLEAWKASNKAILAKLVTFSTRSKSSVKQKSGTCTDQDLKKIESVKSTLLSLSKQVAKQTSVRFRTNHTLGEFKKIKKARLIKAAEETVRKLADSGKGSNQLVKEVAVMNELISSDLSKADMQVVLDAYIDYLFDDDDSKSYQNLAAVVRLFDENPELLDSEGFIVLLSTRIQEKHREKLNAQPEKCFFGGIFMHPL